MHNKNKNKRQRRVPVAENVGNQSKSHQSFGGVFFLIDQKNMKNLVEIRGSDAWIRVQSYYRLGGCGSVCGCGAEEQREGENGRVKKNEGVHEEGPFKSRVPIAFSSSFPLWCLSPRWRSPFRSFPQVMDLLPVLFPLPRFFWNISLFFFSRPLPFLAPPFFSRSSLSSHLSQIFPPQISRCFPSSPSLPISPTPLIKK